MEGDNPPFYEFPPVNKEQWEDLIKKDLQGQDYKKTLKWETLEGIEAMPVYTSEDVKSHFSIHKYGTGWVPCYPIYKQDDVKALITRCGEDHLQAAFWLYPEKQVIDHIEIKELLGKLSGLKKTIFVDSENDFSGLLEMFSNTNDSGTEFFIKFDPFVNGLTKGKIPSSDKYIKEDIKKRANSGLHSLCANGAYYRNRGASIVQETGILIAAATEYLAIMDDASSAETIWFKTSTGPLYFPELAKYRAIRLLWNRLMGTFGVSTEGNLRLFTETSGYNKSRSDAYNNMVRLTNEAMSAVMGGTDFLMIYPYNATFEAPTTFSERMAANIHAILHEEAHLSKVADPAAGSYYIETLTGEIAEKGWNFFRKIENEGGLLKVAQSGKLQAWIDEAARQKENAYATRKSILVGTNHYPNADENLPDGWRDTVAEQQKTDQAEETGVLQITPISELFDRIRDRTKKAAARGKKVNVLLVTAGNRSERSARVTFSQNFLGCAGFRVQQLEGYEQIEATAERLKNKSADLFVLCGSDEQYPEQAAKFAEAVGKKGVLVLAGNPGRNESLYRSLGFEFFIDKESNMLKTLAAIQDKILTDEDLL